MREPVVKELVARLRAHAAHEQHTVYRWIDADLGAPARRDLLDRLRETVPQE